MLQAYYTYNQDIRQEILVNVYILLIIILRFYNIPTIGMKKKLARELLRLRRVASATKFSSAAWRSSRSVFMS